MSAARRDLSRGRGTLIVVDGEAGLGKTRLVAQALSGVGGGRASRIVTVECVAETSAELGPIRIALATVWGTDIAGAPPLASRAVAQLFPGGAGPAPAQTHDGVTLSRTELFAGLLAAFAASSAKRGTILVLEDIHWADTASLTFLAALAAQIDAMRLLVIATTRRDLFDRTDVPADSISRLLRGRAVRRIELQPLSQSDVSTLVNEAVGGASAVAGATIAAIVQRSEGNPFFAEELVKAALESRTDRTMLPPSIRASIRQRLALLGEDHRSVLDVAAVLGVRFDHAFLAELAARPHADVLRMLQVARIAGIVDEVDADTFRFHHAVTRETIYETLLIAETRALHERILALLAAGPEEERSIEALAYHAWQSGDADATLRYSERAGDWALERGMFGDARVYFERTLAATADDVVRARVRERLGVIAAAQANSSAAIAAFETALALRTARGDLDDAARIVVLLGVERSNSGADPVPGLEAFLERYDGVLSVRAHDAVTVFLARVMTSIGAFVRAESLLANVIAPEELEPRVHANYIACRLNMSEYRGDAEGWRVAASELRALAPLLSPLLRSVQLTTLAQTGAWLGEGAMAREALAEAQALAERWGFEGLLVFSRAVEAQLAFLHGRLEDARDALDAVAQRPDVPPAQKLAARIGPFVAAALRDASLADRYLNAGAVRAARERNEIDELLHLEAGLLATENAAARRHRSALFLDLLLNLEPGRFVPPPVTVAAAEWMDVEQLPKLVAVVAQTHATGVPRAVCDLIVAIAGRRSGMPAPERADAAARQFRVVNWPRFETLAREQSAVSAAAGADDAGVLTARETEIARLIADGLTNARIAERLDVGVKTIEKHVSNILAKLNARSRTRIAAFIVEGQANSNDAL